MIKPFIHSDDILIIEKLSKVRSTFWIAGGAPLNWYQGLPADSDIDLYFKSEQDYNKLNDALSSAYESDDHVETDTYFTLFTSPSKKKPRMFDKDVLVQHRHNTENAVTYTLAITDKNREIDENFPVWKIQLIKRRYYDTVTEVIDDFDITVCQIAVDSFIKPVASKLFAEDVAARRLRFNKLSPGSAKRLIKYWTYGYTPSDDTLQLVMDYPELDLKVSENDY